MGYRLNVALALGGLALAGCTRVSDPVDTTSDPIETLRSSGLPAASAGQVLADAEETDIRVVMVRATADYDRSYLGLIVSEETVRFADGYLSGGARNKVITLDGVPITFVDGVATHRGQTFRRFTYRQGVDAQIEGIYSYDGLEEEGFDVEALYLFGFQTGEEVLALRDGPVTYLGQFSGYGHVADGGYTVIGSEIEASGDISLTADFSTSRISGTVTGQADFADGIALNGSFEDAEIVGNGFASPLNMVCPEGGSCSNASSLGGGVFGETGGEIGGIIGFDQTQATGGAGPLRFIGVAGYTATDGVE